MKIPRGRRVEEEGRVLTSPRKGGWGDKVVLPRGFDYFLDNYSGLPDSDQDVLDRARKGDISGSRS